MLRQFKCLAFRILNSVTMDLNREHFRAMIFSDYTIGLSHHECHEQLIQTFSNSFPTVTNWYLEFTRYRDSLRDVPRTGRPQMDDNDGQ